MNLETQMGNNPSFRKLVDLNTQLNSVLLFAEDARFGDVLSLYSQIGDVLLSLLGSPSLTSSNYKPLYFRKQEYCNSLTADRHHITNTFEDNSSLDCNFRHLCRILLDPARKQLGSPIMITSGYRCKELNKIVGGVANSRHINALAADLVCHDNDKLYDILFALPHKELIKHSTYIHVAI